MRLATWNINSVRLRLPLLKRLGEEHAPDVICLQETKCPDDLFPHMDIHAMGYTHRHIHGMKGYNGVAILSRLPFTTPEIHHRVNKQDCRHISVKINGTTVHNLYIPAGGDVPDRATNDKFAHKLDLVAELAEWFPARHTKTEKILACGDFNIAPREHDVWSHKQLVDVVSHTPIEIETLARFQNSMSFIDGSRAFVPSDQKCYTWWSYRNNDWKKSNRGRRLDHIWVTPPLASSLKAHSIITDARDWDQPSDHVPVMMEIG